MFVQTLLAFPRPTAIRALTLDAFLAAAAPVVGREVNTRAWLTEVDEPPWHFLLPWTVRRSRRFASGSRASWI